MDPSQQNPHPGSILRPNTAPSVSSVVPSSPVPPVSPVSPVSQVPPAPYQPAPSQSLAPPPAVDQNPYAAAAQPGVGEPATPVINPITGTAMSYSPPPTVIAPSTAVAPPGMPTPAPAAPYGPPAAMSPYATPAQSPYGLAAPLPPGQLQPGQPSQFAPPAYPTAAGMPAPFPPPAAAVPPQPLDNSFIDPYDSQPKIKSVPGSKLALMAGAATVLVISLIVVAANWTSQPPPNNGRANVPQQTGNLLPDIMARPDGTLELTNKLDISKAIKPQSIQARVKEQINLSSGFSFLARGIGSYQSGTAQPQAGKKFVLVHVVVGNRARMDNISVSHLDFKLRDAGNRMLSSHPHTQQITNNLLASPTELKPGEQIDGRLVYEVEATEKEWELVHRESYQKTTDNTSFTVEGRLILDIRSEGAATP